MTSPRYKVVLTEHLDDEPAAWLAERVRFIRQSYEDGEALRRELTDADGLLVRTYTQVNDDLLAAAPKLKVVGRAGVGLDNIDLGACRRRGVRVVYTPDANTQAVVEYVWALILDALRPRIYLTTWSGQASDLERSLIDGGPVFRQFRGDPAGAIAALRQTQSGEAVGAIIHATIGDIDLIWGDRGFGLAKILARHPEVVDSLGRIVSSMPVIHGKTTANSIHLSDEKYYAVIRTNWKGRQKQWLLTAFGMADASGEVHGSAGATPDGPMRARPDGGAAITSIADLSASAKGLGLDSVDPRAFHRYRTECCAARQLNELTLGILGMGRIGRRVAQVAQAFGMRVIYNDLLSPQELRLSADLDASTVDKPTLWRESDVLTIHIDGRPSNRHLFNADVLRQLKPSCTLINTARGNIIDSVALAAWARGVADGGGGAVLDVHDPEPPPAEYPLWGIPNVRLLPHLASRTATAMANMSWVVRDVDRVLRGEEPEWPAV